MSVSFEKRLWLTVISGSAALWTVSVLPRESQHWYWLAGLVWGLIWLWTFIAESKEEINLKALVPAVLMLHLSALLCGPILEDDFYRYSWDGRNIRSGIHPYSHSPYEQVLGVQNVEVQDLGFDELGVEEDLKSFPEYTRNINYPMYRTVYPPLTEVLFISEILAPNTIFGWPLFIFIIDLLIIFALFKKSKLPPALSLLVITNPLLIKEGLNSWHFDFFLIPLLLLWVLSTSISKGILLGLISGIRPWFLCFILWKFKDFKIKDWLFFALTLGIPWAALFLFPGFPENGFSSWKAFVREWEFNALFFELISSAAETFTEDSQKIRAVSWITGFALIGILWKLSKERGIEIAAALGWLLFLPTVNPWYIMPPAIALTVCSNVKLKALGAAFSVSTVLAYNHYAFLTPGNYLHWSWALLELGIAVLCFFICIKRFSTAETVPQLEQN